MRVFATALGQHLNVSKCSLTPIGRLPSTRSQPLPEAVCGVPVRTSFKALGVVNSNSLLTSRDTHTYWQDLVSKVSTTYDKLSRLRLSAMGRGLAASTFGVSRFLYHAEFMGLPPPAVLQQLHDLSRKLVDANNKDGPPGVPSQLLSGAPSAGGFGLLPWQQHIIGRHLVWACRLLTYLALPGRPEGIQGLPALQARRARILKRMDNPALSPIYILAVYGCNGS
jgi:hypothetical protein